MGWELSEALDNLKKGMSLLAAELKIWIPKIAVLRVIAECHREIRYGTASVLHCQPFEIEKDKGSLSRSKVSIYGRLNVTPVKGWAIPKRNVFFGWDAIEVEQHRIRFFATSFAFSRLNTSHPLYNPGIIWAEAKSSLDSSLG